MAYQTYRVGITRCAVSYCRGLLREPERRAD
jgi:hypothetical protein